MNKMSILCLITTNISKIVSTIAEDFEKMRKKNDSHRINYNT